MSLLLAPSALMICRITVMFYGLNWTGYAVLVHDNSPAHFCNEVTWLPTQGHVLAMLLAVLLNFSTTAKQSNYFWPTKRLHYKAVSLFGNTSTSLLLLNTYWKRLRPVLYKSAEESRYIHCLELEKMISGPNNQNNQNSFSQQTFIRNLFCVSSIGNMCMNKTNENYWYVEPIQEQGTMERRKEGRKRSRKAGRQCSTWVEMVVNTLGENKGGKGNTESQGSWWESNGRVSMKLLLLNCTLEEYSW